MGGVGVAVGFLMATVPEAYVLALVLPFAVGTMVGCIILAMGCGRYMQRGGEPEKRRGAA